MRSAIYEDLTQSLIFLKDDVITGVVTPYPDKEGALHWAEMLNQELDEKDQTLDQS